jgi:hypothetical protein
MDSAGQLWNFNVLAQRLEFAESIIAPAFPRQSSWGEQ